MKVPFKQAQLTKPKGTAMPGGMMSKGSTGGGIMPNMSAMQDTLMKGPPSNIKNLVSSANMFNKLPKEK